MNNCGDFKENLANHDSVAVDIKSETGKFSHWVHIGISNAKSVLWDTDQSIGSDYLQNYLN